MRNSKSAFCPVVVKQEPRDPSDEVPPTCTTTTTTATTTPTPTTSNHNSARQLLTPSTDPSTTAPSSAQLHHHHHRPGTGTGPAGAGGITTRGGGAAAPDKMGGYRSSQEFVAEIARRVREESNSALRGLDLTPVSALGPLVNADLNLAGLGALYSSPALVVAPPLPHAPPLPAESRSGKSRGEFACGECSSRFDTARDFRAHCLTHQVLMAESKLRRTRGEGGVDGVAGEDGEGEEAGMCGGVGAFVGGGARGAGLVMEGGAGFTCEDCDTRFSSRDTYAMHMLIRAKNEACFPHRSASATGATPTTASTAPPPPPLPSSSSSSAAATTNVTAANNINITGSDNANNDSNSSLCSASSVTNSSHLPLLSPALLLAAATNSPAELKREPVGRAEAVGGGAGVGVGGRGRSLADPAHQLMTSLGVDMGRLADYSPAWWSKYMPWMAAGLLSGASAGDGGGGGGGGGGEGPALPMVCYMCGELFSNRDSLAMHVLFHTRDTPSTSTAKGASPGPRWRKPLPSLGSSSSVTPPSSGSASSGAVLLMGQAALGQLQHHQPHLSPFSLSHGARGYTHHHHHHELSPSEAEAVASAAAAAAVAAVAVTAPPRQTTTPPGHAYPSPGALHNGFTGSRSRRDRRGVGGEAGETLSSRENESGDKSDSKPMDWAASSLLRGSGTGAADESSSADSGCAGQLLVLPQRGASAPVTGSAHFYATSPSSASATDLSNDKSRDRSRPLSADHVVLRYNNHKPLLTDPAADAGHHHRHHLDPHRHSDDVIGVAATVGAGQWNKADKDPPRLSNGNVLWNNGADSAHLQHSSAHLQHSSAFHAFRLQRLKKLRLAKGVYRRPGARGRPPMTIYGTAGSPRRQQHPGVRSPVETAATTPLFPAPSSSPEPSSSSSSSATAAASSSSSANRVGSMVKLLTAQGHEVSACVHCQLLFGDRTLYQLHMGLHNVNNPWQCNACGLACSSRLHFATHTLHY